MNTVIAFTRLRALVVLETNKNINDDGKVVLQALHKVI